MPLPYRKFELHQVWDKLWDKGKNLQIPRV